MEKVFQIADNIHGLIKCSFIEREIIACCPFNRLHYILQNSTAYKTFPSNQTSRLSHSLGTMHLSGKFMYYSVLNSDIVEKERLISLVKETCNGIMQDTGNKTLLRGAQCESVLKSGWKTDSLAVFDEYYKTIQLPGVEEKNQIFYKILYQSVRCAALLHDIGHPPYSHIVEFALANVERNISKKEKDTRTVGENQFMGLIEQYINESGKIDLHEKIGNNLSSRILENLFTQRDHEKNKNEEDYCQNSLFVFLVWKITEGILKSKPSNEVISASDYSPLYSDFHNIVSGSIDCDRLDYVVRDMNNSGFEKGRIEYERLLESTKLVSEAKLFTNHGEAGQAQISKEIFRVSFDIRCLNTVEDFFKRRWNLYKELIYHHSVRKTDALLERIVFELSKQTLEKEDEEKIVNAYDVKLALPMHISGLWEATKLFNSDSELFNATIQWKDNWLISTLEKFYFDNFNYENQELPLMLMLDEFLKNDRKFYSKIKRLSDFKILDKFLCEKIAQKELKKFILEEIKNEDVEIVLSVNSKHPYADLADTSNETNFFNEKFVNFFKKFEKSFKSIDYGYEQFLVNSFDKMIRNLNIKCYIYTINKDKTNEPLDVVFHNGNAKEGIELCSVVVEELRLSAKSFPAFYLYTSDSTKTQREILEELASCMIDELKEKLPQTLNGSCI